MEGKPKDAKNRRGRSAVLWILSGFIVLVGIALLQLIVRFATPSPSIASDGTLMVPPVVTVVNLLSALGGIVGVCLIPIGIVVGVIKLSRG